MPTVESPNLGESQAPTIETVSKRSPWGALINRTLPDYGGPFPVGVCDIEVPVKSQTFGTFTHKDFPGADAGLAMDTVLFSMFYPADAGSSKDQVVWFPKLTQTIDGFLRMAQRQPNIWYRMLAYPIAAAAIYGTTFPAKPNAPLRAPPASEDPANPSKNWPLMIFSHGVGCSRLMYSAFCGEMASRGFVVCAIEHRDGTSPSSTIVNEDGETKKLDWLQWSDLDWPDMKTQPEDDTILRHEQIKMRVAEMEEVLKIMTAFSRGENPPKTSPHAPDFNWSAWRAVETNKPVIAGHSLGGCAAIAAAADTGYEFSSVLAFDPAIQRLEPWSRPIPAPLFCVNSEEFINQEDFGRLAALAKYAHSSSIFSTAGTTHPSFSDVFVILPSYVNKLTGLKADAAEVVRIAVRAVSDFLAGRMEAMRARAVTVQGAGLAQVAAMEPGTFVHHEV
ncbi:hypothetical protein HWV62_31495 [Athelia sp. TMB]|nr:hypothetical protein HWV62_33988 [Athelia sp. TMB]KAF7981902.1 hypothetical protein HWV62_31495 [Athelia sp. TMB]